VRALTGPMTLRYAPKIEKRQVGAAVVDQASGSYVKISRYDCWELPTEEEVPSKSAGPKLKLSVFSR